MASVVYSYAKEVEETAQPIIKQYHGHINDFSVRIEYVFMDKVPKKGGKEVWAYVKKVTSLNAFLATESDDSDPFFVMVVAQPIWLALPKKAKAALVDHELCHIGAELTQKDEEQVVKLSVIPHDMEEFNAITRRHGLWRDEIETEILEKDDDTEKE